MTTDTIQFENDQILVPNNPTIPFISGDGVGPEIWAASQPVFDAVIAHVYSDRKIQWKPVLAGGQAFEKEGTYLPDETIHDLKKYKVAIKCPLMTPVGGGIRSLNVAIRKTLDLYACVRPVKWFEGVPSPVKHPEQCDMVIFRENTEDVYSGIEWRHDSEEVKKLKSFLLKDMGVTSIRFPSTSAIGIKPVSKEGSERLVRSAIVYALSNNRSSVTLVHKGNIMKFTEGAFRDFGYDLAETEFQDKTFTWRKFESIKADQGADAAKKALSDAQAAGKLIIKDCIADAFFQNSLLNPAQYSVVATTNLNGDYISDALAAQVGGIGISPGANINYKKGYAVFEATHGTAPLIAGQNKANPSAVLLSGVMLFEYLGWTEAAQCLESAIAKTIKDGLVTEDLSDTHTTCLGTQEYASAIIDRL